MDNKIYKITKLETQKNNKNRISIYINGKFALGAHKEIVINNGLKEDKIVDKEKLEKVIVEEEQNKANSYALNLLSYRSRSEKEIINKMKSKGYEMNNIEKSLSFLKKYDYIDDKNFAQEFTREKSKKIGRNRIKMELTQKGIMDNIINEVVEDIDREAEYDLALKLANKKMKSYKDDDKRSKYRKMGGFLQRRGFDYDIIRKVLKTVLNEDE